MHTAGIEWADYIAARNAIEVAKANAAKESSAPVAQGKGGK